jgi:polyribonucleotide nucleotidyltransferase
MAKEFKIDINGKELKVFIKNLAEQTSGNVLVQYGETTVLATVVMSQTEREGIDFFPLMVDYEERYYAAGKILGSRYLRRESRPSDEAVLTSRFIDRAIRPRFPKNLKKEVQVVVTCLSWDKENDPDVIGLFAASLALSISNIPWSGPVAALRVGQPLNQESFVLNPSYQQREESCFEIALTGLELDDKIIVNMIEMEGNEVEEETVAKAFQYSQQFLKQQINFQKQITEQIGQEKIKLNPEEKDLDLEKEIKEFLNDSLEKYLYQEDKASRKENLAVLQEKLFNYLDNKYNDPKKIQYAKSFLEEKTKNIIEQNIIKNNKRPDHRKIDQIRPISFETSLLPRTHGSGLFTRGQTKSLSILTLGAPSDVKLMEGMEISGKKRFMHHYNFPAYSVGEVRPMRGPGRRDIGHGMLAEKALLPVIPSFDDFPYTIRIVTEILSSNGSTSMASISSSCLALMDAGVPIKKPVAGIALGIIGDKILTDIQGPEDHYGGMDFKVAGTEKGITAIQMDVKIDGIDQKVFQNNLEQGRKARMEILKQMAKTISEPRKTLSPYAPRILTLQINPAKIREVIGPGGKVINEIIEECGVSIDIEDSGKIFITSENEQAAKKAIDWIKNITREVKIDEVFQGKVKRILDFGAFVEILPGQEGLVHISQLAAHRVNKVEDVVKIGEIVPVKVISIDEQGRINLSIKAVEKNKQ